MPRKRTRTQGVRALVQPTRVSDREKRALRVVGLARGIPPSNVFRHLSLVDAMALYDEIVEVVREELEDGDDHDR